MKIENERLKKELTNYRKADEVHKSEYLFIIFKGDFDYILEDQINISIPFNFCGNFINVYSA